MNFILALQHLLACFGATVLVPLLTGLNPSVALFGAGVGTLIFHGITKGKVPVFLGSSFAFIVAIQIVVSQYGLSYATGGIIFAGLLYLVLALLIKVYGIEKIKTFFPPTVTGSMIAIIGLTLAPGVIQGNIVDADVGTLGQRLFIAFVVVATMVIISIFAKGFFKLVPILFGIVVGYIVSLLLNVVDFVPVIEAGWFSIPPFILPKFGLEAILIIAPVAVVTFIEHFGDIVAISEVTGNNFLENPGVHKTLLSDGIASIFAGLIGAPANTTYSENTAVLAVTRVYKPEILRLTALLAILVAFVGKLGALLLTLPSPVIGGVSIILFGMIASIGLRTFVDNKVDFSKNKNLLVVSLMLVLGLSGLEVPVWGQATLSGLSLSALVGIVLNKVLPD
ncbi:MAG: purine/pyrimidine permease [Clostridiales bacterium]|nr:purine/pyrimidine permease [Clostridiales bacterium]